MNEPPAIHQLAPSNFVNNTTNIVTIPASKTVVILTADGKLMRDGREIKDLPRDELLVIIGELVDLIRRK